MVPTGDGGSPRDPFRVGQRKGWTQTGRPVTPMLGSLRHLLSPGDKYLRTTETADGRRDLLTRPYPPPFDNNRPIQCKAFRPRLRGPTVRPLPRPLARFPSPTVGGYPPGLSHPPRDRPRRLV